jgi:hypothetical protein
MLGLLPRRRSPFFSRSHLACVQAAAAARVADKDSIHEVARRGDIAAVQDYLIADASCVNQTTGWYDWTPPTPAFVAQS